MSTPHARLTAQAVEEVRAHERAYDRFHDAVAAFFRVNRTDLRCLDLLDQRGKQTAGELSAATGLTTGSVTAMLDRLERAGYVRRLHDPGDRRRVLVEPTEFARERAREIYEPFARRARPLSERFSEEQVATILEFVRSLNDFYSAQTARVEALARGSGSPKDPGGPARATRTARSARG